MRKFLDETAMTGRPASGLPPRQGIPVPHDAPLQGRLLLVDGLRGVAAMMVVLYHLYAAIETSVSQWFPAVIGAALHQGNLGVDIFFVLSGFVIPHSIRNGKYSLSYLGRFALRRSIRLDPPLWVTIAIELVLIRLGLAAFADLGTPVPSIGQVLTNVFYLQEILGTGSIVPAFWSLTFEVQFYVVVVAFLVLMHWLVGRGLSKRNAARMQSLVLVGAFVWSLAIYHQLISSPVPGLFVIRWFQFFLGAIAWAAVSGRMRPIWFVLGCSVALVSGFLFPSLAYRTWSTAAAVGTSALLFWAGTTGKMTSLLSGRFVQFLGMISYSLYLIHQVIGERFVGACVELYEREFSIAMGLGILGTGVALSVLAAWIMYRLLEAPSMRFARRIRLPERVAER